MLRALNALKNYHQSLGGLLLVVDIDFGNQSAQKSGVSKSGMRELNELIKAKTVQSESTTQK